MNVCRAAAPPSEVTFEVKVELEKRYDNPDAMRCLNLEHQRQLSNVCNDTFIAK